MIIRLPIDIKSLFYNILNDNKTGHTATVNTNIVQGKSVNNELLNVYKIEKDINIDRYPDLVELCLKHSKSYSKIEKIFIFDKIAVNGNLLDLKQCFCMYIKEEVDPDKIQFGRKKLHYPLTLKYVTDDFSIDNKAVINSISKQLNNYAFITNGFEFDSRTGILNFDISIIGPEKIPYSKVFINNKGNGNKFNTIFNNELDRYDYEIFAMKQKVGFDIGPEEYINLQKEYKRKAIDIVVSELKKDQTISDIYVLSEYYPWSLYDIEYKKNGMKNYFIVQQTVTNNEYMLLTQERLIFLNLFQENVNVAIVIDVCNRPIINYYTIDEINEFNKLINSIIIKRR